MTDEPKPSKNLWSSKSLSLVLVILALSVTVLVPGVGVIAAFALVLIAAIVGRKAGSFRDMGMSSPGSWTKLLVTTLAYGVGIQLVFTILVEPLLEKMTGSAVDISVLDPMRGNLLSSLAMIAVGWAVGGFLEEFTFRGYVVTRVRELLGNGSLAIWIAVLAAAIPFGIAHM